MCSTATETETTEWRDTRRDEAETIDEESVEMFIVLASSRTLLPPPSRDRDRRRRPMGSSRGHGAHGRRRGPRPSRWKCVGARGTTVLVVSSGGERLLRLRRRSFHAAASARFERLRVARPTELDVDRDASRSAVRRLSSAFSFGCSSRVVHGAGVFDEAGAIVLPGYNAPSTFRNAQWRLFTQ